jgi:hypothetical protein
MMRSQNSSPEKMPLKSLILNKNLLFDWNKSILTHLAWRDSHSKKLQLNVTKEHGERYFYITTTIEVFLNWNQRDAIS